MDKFDLDSFFCSIKDILSVIFGSFIVAFGLHFVIVPAHLLTGGVSGISIIIHFLTEQPLWIWYILLNVPIFFAGYKLISRRFTFYSLIGTLGVSFFLAGFSYIHFTYPINDLLLSALLGGTINGIGLGINLRSHGSSGGLDIIAMIINRYRGISLGTTFFICNLVILATSFVTGNLQLTLYSAITMYVTSKVIDAVTAGIDAKKTVMIVSNRSQDIADVILHKMKRGCTILNGRGAYTGKNEDIILVTTGRTQIPYLKTIIFDIDPHSFVTITDTVEVYGKGFKDCSMD